MRTVIVYLSELSLHTMLLLLSDPETADWLGFPVLGR